MIAENIERQYSKYCRNFKDNQILKKILTSLSVFGFPAVINLVSLLVFTRILTLENYGLLSLSLISVELLQSIAFNWIKMGMMRFYDTDNRTSSLSVGLHFNFTVSLLLLVAIFLLLTFGDRINATDTHLISLLVILSIGRGFCNFLQDYIRISNTNLNKYTLIAVLSNGSYYVPAIIFLFVSKTQSIKEILLLQAVGIYSFLILYSIKCLSSLELKPKQVKKFFFELSSDWQNRTRKSIKDKKAIYIAFLKYGLPLIIVALSISMFVRIDRFIIEHNVGLKELGAYSAAFSLSNLIISSFFTILTLPTYPEIIRKLNQGDEQAAKVIHNRNGNIILAVAVPLLIFSGIFNELLCKMLFGEKGSEISLLFPLVVLGTFLYNCKVHYFDQIFQFCHKTNAYMALGIITGLSHFFLAYNFSILWGAKGVAYSGILLNFLSIIFIYFYSRKFFKVTFNKRLCLLMPSLLIISSGIWGIKHYLL